MTNNNAPDLASYIDELIAAKGLATIDPDLLEEMKKDLAARLEDQINATILANIPSEKLTDFEEFLSSESDENVQAFLRANILDLDEVIAQALVRFRNAYLGL
ncbi:MAG: DUF5663 domain-containing protein [Patescibacteria group bacterium]